MERGALTLLAISVAGALLVAVGACVSTTPDTPSIVRPDSHSPLESSTPSPTATQAATIQASPTGATLAEAPSDCPGPKPRSQTVADFVGPVVGEPPLWAGVYATYDAASNSYSAPDAPLTEYGWQIKILYLIEPGQDGTIELVGAGVENTAGSVTFAVGGVSPSMVATFDPMSPAIPVTHEGWREYPTYAYFPSVGCYLLTATWTDGSSQLGFGFGG